jgi:hypothetical protein
MKRLALAVLLLSAIAASAPQLVRALREAASMRGLAYRVRRERQMGRFYPSVNEVLRATPANEPLALIVPKGTTRDIALFFDYYAYPRRTKIYRESGYYGVDPNPPKSIARIGDVASVTTYGAMRLEDLRHDGPLVRNPVLRDAGTSFFVPLAASIDGVFPARYAVEATIAAAKPAQVTFTFRPKNLVKTLTIDGARHFDDLVYELFGVLDRGWLEVASSEPLRASFAFATRPLGADELPIVHGAPPGPVHVARGNSLWVVNPSPIAAALRVNGKGDYVGPYESVSRAYACPCDVEVVTPAGARVYAFATERQPDGRSRFLWPEGTR